MVRETKVTEPASTYPRPQKIIRRKDLPQYVGLHRSVIIEMIQAGTFPPGIRLTPSAKHSGALGWLESTIHQWQQERARAVEEEMRLKNRKLKKTWFDKI
jgi:predicted DNA-binding transcriptional regulator AlpA